MDAVKKSFDIPKFKEQYENYIGGEWVAPKSGEYFDCISRLTANRLPRSPARTKTMLMPQSMPHMSHLRHGARPRDRTQQHPAEDSRPHGSRILNCSHVRKHGTTARRSAKR